LRKLFNEGITCSQLAQCGLRKCDFFAKKENYEIFLSQIPSLETRNSIDGRLSDIFTGSVRTEAAVANSQQNKKKNVTFKLDLRESSFKDMVDKYKDDEFIIT
jgi:hypothetical protein